MEGRIIISPSIASCDQMQLMRELEKVEASGCSDVHIDIEDGNFVPNISFGKKTVRALRQSTGLPFSFHLMTRLWRDYTSFCATQGASIVFAHFEALDYPREFIFHARSLGLRCGLAFNPKTPVEHAQYLLGDLNGILLLATEPDDAGEPFLPHTLERAAWLRGYSKEMDIWVDGAVTYDMLPTLERAGVTHAVMGRAFFQGER